MNTAAEERRHRGVVAFLSEEISQSQLYRRCVLRFDGKKASVPSINITAKCPSIKWFTYQFWPSNEFVRSAFKHSGRFPLRLQLQVPTPHAPRPYVVHDAR